MRRTHPSVPRRAAQAALWTSLALAPVALIALIAGCGQNELQPANTAMAADNMRRTDDSRDHELEQKIIDHEMERRAGEPVLPIMIFPTGDGDDHMLPLPANDAEPAATGDNARNIPVAFVIPANPETATGRAENLQRVAVGVLMLDDSQPQKIYRLADFSRVKLAGQVCRKAFNTWPKESGVAMPEALTLQEGYPAIFSAAYIYRDLDMIEQAPVTAGAASKEPAAADPAGVDATGAAATEEQARARARRNVRVIRTHDIDGFLKDNKADVLALLVIQIDDTNQNERLVALWLWSRDPVTNSLFKPSACVQAHKIDLKWPEATDNEQIQMWHSLIELERRLMDQKTVVIDRPRKTTP